MADDKKKDDDKKGDPKPEAKAKDKFGPPNANYTGKVYNPETEKFVSYVKGHKVSAPK